MVSGDLAAATQESRQAVDLSFKVSEMRPDDVTATVALATAYRVHGGNELWAGHYPAAVEAADKGVAVMEPLYRLWPDDREVARTLGSAYSSKLVLPYDQISPEDLEQKLMFAHKALALDMHLFDTDPQHEMSNWRNIGADWNGLGILLTLKGDLPAAVDAFRTASADMEKTTADTHNAQAQVDVARSHMNLERARFAAGHLAEAHEGLLKNIALLESILRDNDTREIQYLLASCEEELGSIEAQWAEAAKDPAQQLRQWRSAGAWFAKSAPRFKRILGAASLDIWDRPPVDHAIAGVARSTAEIRRLEDQETLAHR
jgi:tetratricopeptide (TPR) repeat protein